MASVGDSIQAKNANWSFNGEVAKTFDNHVARSVPLYQQGHDLVAKTSDFFLSNGSICYELGCSTGVLTMRIAERNCEKDIQIIGIDCEEGMVERARDRCKDMPSVEIIQGDIIDFDFKKADMIVAYYTIQFVKPKVRQLLFNRIFEALNWGGALVLFEKVRAPDARFQDMMSAFYVDFKLDGGYNSEEIISKSRSLKGVLEPFSSQGNIDLMKRAGFVDVMTVMKYVCFEGFLAIK